MTTAIMQTSTGRPGRVFLANFLGGPLVAGLLFGLAFPVIVAVITGRMPSSDVFRLTGIVPMLAFGFFISNFVAGLGAALYATIQVKRIGSYSAPIAIAIAAGIPLITGGMLLFAAAGAAVAGWLTRRSGATWSFS